MFGRSFSFWRHLVGKTTPSSEDVQSDRRLWVRYPADVRTNVGPAAAPEENRVSAQIRDISIGGAHLLVDRPFKTGQMLSLELPHAGEEECHTVLACVVRAKQEGQGQWVLGCVFSRELSDEDLEGFGAKRVRPPASDQRTWMRFATNIQANYQKIGDPENRSFSAQVLNLSANGVGLLVTEVVNAGALVSVNLVAADGKTVRTILACVVHVTTQAHGWALGCNFIRQLSEEDLKALL
jgi:c-di-GMP-binding flagellar brake protein YcgR